MHAIVMVHKMQSMTLSNNQLLPNTTKPAPADDVKDDPGEDHPLLVCPLHAPLSCLFFFVLNVFL